MLYTAGCRIFRCGSFSFHFCRWELQFQLWTNWLSIGGSGMWVIWWIVYAQRVRRCALVIQHGWGAFTVYITYTTFITKPSLIRTQGHPRTEEAFTSTFTPWCLTWDMTMQITGGLFIRFPTQTFETKLMIFDRQHGNLTATMPSCTCLHFLMMTLVQKPCTSISQSYFLAIALRPIRHVEQEIALAVLGSLCYYSGHQSRLDHVHEYFCKWNKTASNRSSSRRTSWSWR
jgi:hypothetical protein